jgi:large subunit ribosomal protein L33
MAKKGPRILITLECTECKRQNYTTEKNRQNTPGKLELKKFCQGCRKKTLHKEVK